MTCEQCGVCGAVCHGLVLSVSGNSTGFFTFTVPCTGHPEPGYGRSERPHGLSWTVIDRTRCPWPAEHKTRPVSRVPGSGTTRAWPRPDFLRFFLTLYLTPGLLQADRDRAHCEPARVEQGMAWGGLHLEVDIRSGVGHWIVIDRPDALVKPS